MKEWRREVRKKGVAGFKWPNLGAKSARAEFWPWALTEPTPRVRAWGAEETERHRRKE